MADDDQATETVAIRLADPQGQLIAEIADATTTIRSLTLTYALAQREPNLVDWPAVNRAIVVRWSVRALDKIKAAARRMTERKADR